MRIESIDFPDPIITALRNSELVVFAGAGVSMPAGLPDFKGLVEKIEEKTGENKEEETEDQFLGRLHNEGIRVHKIASKILTENNPKPTTLHHNLLRLYDTADKVRIVTTNFDLLFRQAARKVFKDSQPKIFSAPALPSGERFHGIVHVHGDTDNPSEMVLTDKDFGRSYLTEGSARRFLVDLFQKHTVLFVGYSHNDTIMNYLARALPVSNEVKRFALTEQNNSKHWQSLGIELIKYSPPQALDEGIKGLADTVNSSYWKQKVTEVAKRPPPSPLDKETEDIIKYGFKHKDKELIRFFTYAARAPEWINWLNKHDYFNGLFSIGQLKPGDIILANWLAEHFACQHANNLFWLISRHNFHHTNDLFRLIPRHEFHLNPDFWERLGHAIVEDKQKSLTKGILSRWVILLLKTIPNNIQQDDILAVLTSIGERCTFDSLIDVFYAMTKSRLLIESYSPFPDKGSSLHRKFGVAVSPVGKHSDLQQLWGKRIKPRLADVAQPLLQRMVQRFEEQHFILNLWKQASPDYTRNSYRLAIEPHEQDQYPHANDVLIDVARDCLEWLILNKTEATLQWCDQSTKSEVLLLRRLAVHTISECEELTANEKIDWLLDHVDLYDIPAHHEIFRAVKIAYAKASTEHREKIINAILAFSRPNREESNREEKTAYEHFNWLAWLRDGNSCKLLQKALNDIKKRYPKVRESMYPDLLSWLSTRSYEDLPSPLTAEELLDKSIDELPLKLLSLIENAMPTEKILAEVKKAAEKDFEWGNNLANVLANKKKWDVNVWDALMQAWQEVQLDEDKYRPVIQWLGKTELHSYHAQVIAWTLYSLVKVQNGNKPFILTLLPEMNNIAMTLWHNLRHRKFSIGNFDSLYDNQLHEILNYTTGVLTEFWLFSFSLYRKQQDPPPKTLNNEYRTILSTIIQESGPMGIRGRSVLASWFNCLLDIDEKWTKDNLLPLFIKDEDTENFRATWNGFLFRGHLDPTVAKLLEEAFLRAIQQVDENLSHNKEKFIEYYTAMLSYYVENPMDKWIPELFNCKDKDIRLFFALNIGFHLRVLDDGKQQELWKRWLKEYWEKRLYNIYAILEAKEIEIMLEWLPYLNSVFPEAVELAIKMPLASEQRFTLHKSELGKLLENHPEPLAKLLIYLGEWENLDPEITWYETKELIDKLLESNIPSPLKKELEELIVKLHLK